MGFDIAETDRLLTTTRSVRRRLDRTRPVDNDLLKRCLEIAVQAPTGSKLEDWRWLVVTDPAQRQRIGQIYADTSARYLEWWRFTEPDLDETSPAVVSARVLWEHLDEVPALVFPCFQRHGWHRSNPNRQFVEASVYGSIFPAVWSFQLACHARGLGSCLITGHLNNEQAVADILGLPDDIGQAGMVAVAHLTDDRPFRPAKRPPSTRFSTSIAGPHSSGTTIGHAHPVGLSFGDTASRVIDRHLGDMSPANMSAR